MAIARRIQWYLDTHTAQYDLIRHPHSRSSAETARLATIPEDKLAKCILVEDERGYLMTIVPASRRIDLRRLCDFCSRSFELASEGELGEIFHDCETGAVPPMANAYGIPVMLDDSLLGLDEIYFEAGDHEGVVHMSGEQFLDLLPGCRHAMISRAH